MNAKPSFFTQEEKYTMMDHNVSAVLAYTRIKQLEWDRRRAITEEVNRTDRRKEALKTIETDVKTDTVYEINWKR